MPNRRPQGDAWTVAAAKAHFSEVIAQAQTEPQTITRNGRPSVIMVSVDEWQRRVERKGSLGRFLTDSPLAGADLELGRIEDESRDVAL